MCTHLEGGALGGGTLLVGAGLLSHGLPGCVLACGLWLPWLPPAPASPASAPPQTSLPGSQLEPEAELGEGPATTPFTRHHTASPSTFLLTPPLRSDWSAHPECQLHAALGLVRRGPVGEKAMSMPSCSQPQARQRVGPGSVQAFGPLLCAPYGMNTGTEVFKQVPEGRTVRLLGRWRQWKALSHTGAA